MALESSHKTEPCCVQLEYIYLSTVVGYKSIVVLRIIRKHISQGKQTYTQGQLEIMQL